MVGIRPWEQDKYTLRMMWILSENPLAGWTRRYFSPFASEGSSGNGFLSPPEPRI